MQLLWLIITWVLHLFIFVLPVVIQAHLCKRVQCFLRWDHLLIYFMLYFICTQFLSLTLGACWATVHKLFLISLFSELHNWCSGVGSLLCFTLFYGIQKILFLLLELEHTYLLWVTPQTWSEGANPKRDQASSIVIANFADCHCCTLKFARSQRPPYWPRTRLNYLSCLVACISHRR